MRRNGPCFVGTDIGTLGTKTVIVSSNGAILATGFAEYDVLSPRPLWAEQWPDVWLDGACKSIREALQKANVPVREIACVTISGLYGGSGVPCDDSMTPLRPCLIWMDRRAEEETQWVREHFDEDELFSITGNFIDSYFGYTKILWIQRHEEQLWKKTKWLLTPYGYVIYRLSGSICFDYCSAGNVGGIFDMNARDWSADLLKEMGIPRTLFPDSLLESWEVAGTVSKKGERLSGLAEGTPVCAGGVDAAVATLSAGSLQEGDHVAMIGTSMAYGVIHDGKRYNKQIISMPHVVNARSSVYSFAGATTAGGLAKWFREQFGQVEKLMGSMVSLDPYSVLTLEAQQAPPGAEKLLVLPYFMGDRAPIWNANARGTVFGLTLYHTRGHLFRALMESVAYSLRTCIEHSRSTGIRLNPELVLVGGVTKSELWKSIFADVTGFPITCVRGGGEAAFGDAFLAAMGAGAVDSPQQIKSWITFEERIDPAPDNLAVYDRYYRQFVELYQTLEQSMENLNELP